jgi:uncharacterized coiled-coil DUF342 family protein
MANNYLVLDITGLQQEQSTYRTSALTCSVVLAGKKFGDLSLARADHQLQLPISNVEGNLQLNIWPMTNPNARVGSVSINVADFLNLPNHDTHQQWFTLFQTLEDDIFDGVIGENDSELPMVQLRFYTTEAREERKQESTNTTTTTTSGGVKTTTTVTKTTISSSPTKTTTRTTTSSSSGSAGSDNYSVKALTSHLKSGLNKMVDDLNAEQTDIFSYEDGRQDNLDHLNTVHKELEREHINDQVFGAELTRFAKDVTSGIHIATSGHQDDSKLLTNRIAHTQGIIKEHDAIVDKEGKNVKGLENTLVQKQGQQQTPQATALLKDNEALRKKIQDSTNTVKKEREEKTGIFNKHAEIVNNYNSLVGRYEKSLLDVEVKRVEAERNLNATKSELASESSNGTNLDHFLESTTKSVSYHDNQAKALKAELDSLKKYYASFVSHLGGLVASQSTEVQRLTDHLKGQQTSISDLQKSLSVSAKKIVDLHSEVDRENAANLNAKLSTLISTLVEVDKSRRTSQNNLENSQESWTAKLHLFLDEASRMSRENANAKRATEVVNMLTKLDKLNRDSNELARQRDELQARVLTDSNRDIINENLVKELNSLSLKLQWARDERDSTNLSLQDLLKFLEFKRTFILDQEEQIRTLRSEIEEVRTLIQERITTIIELEGEIRWCDEEIARLRREIEELDRRIQELQDAIAEKDREIDELNRILALRMARIKQLQAELKGSSYVAVKGDLIDEMLAQYIQNCPVPVKRLGGGFYLFGLRKIYAKIMNGKLVIRVGGGYMVIDKFIETYADQELQRLIRVAEREGVSSFMDLDLEQIALGPKSPTGKSPTGKSPTAKSPTFNANASAKMSSINGTKRKTATTTKTTVTTVGTSSGGTQVVITEKVVKK